MPSTCTQSGPTCSSPHTCSLAAATMPTVSTALAGAEAALQLTANAMAHAADSCMEGRLQDKERALAFAETALALSMQRLGSVQALLAHELAAQQAALTRAARAAAKQGSQTQEGDELQDTCSSSCTTCVVPCAQQQAHVWGCQ